MQNDNRTYKVIVTKKGDKKEKTHTHRRGKRGRRKKGKHIQGGKKQGGTRKGEK